jgi:hypothetical protein
VSSRKMRRWLDSLSGAGSGAAAPGPKDVFRQRLQDASNANQAAIARRSEIIAQTLEAKTASEASAATNNNNESEDA